ncbi:putative nuclease HARBI1 [Pristis pectinata]|uniref:putative nuclease HARBI1 n=1 Tax=Pristis pectinata TaxID=685728 RepID=UPI00223E3912|nr:putative nuclease HARBI1 [Pristis pectinata]
MAFPMGIPLYTIIVEDEEEEEEQQRMEAKRIRQHGKRHHPTRYYPPQRIYRQRRSFEDLSEELCIRRVRLSKGAIANLCDFLREDLQPHSTARTALSVEMKVTTALNFFGTGSFQGATGNMCNISQGAVRAAIQQVTDVLFNKAAGFINFGITPRQQRERAKDFCCIAGFPKVQGVIGGTHVALKAPAEQPLIFVNRKGFHSLNVQIVCDAHQKILYVNAKHAGSCHDAVIVQHSTLPDLFHEDNHVQGWLLGDQAYALQTWLMPPLSRPRTQAEEAYNQAQAATRAVVERAIRLLKSRFRCLDRSSGALQYTPQRVARIVIACCVLHNFALQEGHLFNIDDEEPLLPEERELQAPALEEDDQEDSSLDVARAIQKQIVQEEFSH